MRTSCVLNFVLVLPKYVQIKCVKFDIKIKKGFHDLIDEKYISILLTTKPSYCKPSYAIKN